MNKYLLLASLLATPAYAQTQEPPYAPITLTEQEYHSLINTFGELPTKYGYALLGFLLNKEKEAQAATQHKD